MRPAIRERQLRAAGHVLFGLSALLAAFSVVGTWALIHLDVPDIHYETLSRVLGVANIALSFAACLAWMSAAQGFRSAVALLGLCVVIAGGMETLGVLTGIPFGSYEYTDRLGPRVFGAVPVTIPLAWFSMAYPALHLAGWTRLGLIGKAALVGAALTVWDLALDPAMTAELGAWEWQQAGPYYGIPLQNFLAWFLTGALLSGAYLWLARQWRPDASRLPVAMYLLQSVFAALMAILYGRAWAGCVWLVALMALALVTARYYCAGSDPPDGEVA